MAAFRFRLFIPLALLAVLLLAPAPARACNIPVFRFAIDFWPSDPYRLTVFHRGPLAAEHRQQLDRLEKYAAGDTPVEVKFQPAGARTTVIVTHDRLQARADADGLRRAWGEALDRLKATLES